METVRIVRCLPSNQLEESNTSSFPSSNEGEKREVCLPKDSAFRFVEWRKALLNHQRLKHHDEILLGSPTIEVVYPETAP